MDQAQFEQAVLRMAHHGGVQRLTPSAVAYQVRVSVKDAERMLDKMVTNAQLELDSDDDGNLFYFVPGLGTPGVFTAGTAAANPIDPPKAPAPLPGDVPQGYRPAGQPPQYGAPNPQGPNPSYNPSAQQGAGGQYGNANAYNAGNTYNSGTPYGAYGPPAGAAGTPPGPPPYGQPYAGQGAQQQSQFGQPYGAQSGAPSYGAPQYNPGPGGGQYGRPYAPPPPGYVPPGAPGTSYQPHGQGAPVNYAYGQNALVPTGQAGPRSPSTAALLGLVPGAGQLYNGQVGKGLSIFFLTAFLSATPFAVIPWLWGMIDAHNTAKRQNAQQHYGLLGP